MLNVQALYRWLAGLMLAGMLVVSLVTAVAAQELDHLRRLAEQGDAISQYYLGMIYAKGKKVPQDYVQALMWVYLAAEQGLNEAKEQRSDLTEQPWFGQAKMTPEQIQQARDLAKQWKPSVGRHHKQ